MGKVRLGGLDMYTQGSENNQVANAFKILQQAYKNGALTLYLGAGASVPSGLPSWEKLIQSMYFRNMQTEAIRQNLEPYPNYLYAISEWVLSRHREPLDIMIRKIKSRYTESEFLRFLKETLYAGFIQTEDLPDSLLRKRIHRPRKLTAGNPTLEAVVNLCARTIPGDSGVESIITYNYDNLLELALEQHQFQCFQTIWNTRQQMQTGLMPIFHVHGYVPTNGEGSAVHELILSEEHYNRAAQDAFFWGNMVQLQYLGTSVGLMIGLSLADRNIRRLLDTIRHSPMPCRNFIMLRKPKQITLTDKDVFEIDQMSRRYMARFSRSGSGVKSRQFIGMELSMIMTEINRIEKQDTEQLLKELRITPIWYENHEEIPHLLRQIISGS
ncbi:SIR2 family protein [Adhaeribacter soli]|nr:SIR2 family protein [Adhaeribacter soli]